MNREKDYLAEFELIDDTSPFFTSQRKSKDIMIHMMVALIFPTLAAIILFGWQRVLPMVSIGIISAIFFEWIYEKITNKPITISDGSAIITGWLSALSLPTTAPIWTLLLGTAFAIIVVKQLGGGLGRNRFNPAATARVMQKIFLTPWITNWVLPGPDAIATATPLEYIGHFARSVPAQVPNIGELFLGINLGGPMGETCKLAILISFIYLSYKKIIRPRIPIIYLLTLGILAFLWSGFDLNYALTHILSGTAIFGAVFMLTDYSSSPITPKGHEVFAVCAAALCFFLRIVFNLPGGFGISLIIMNFFIPVFDKHFAPRIYGHDKAPKVKVGREVEN